MEPKLEALYELDDADAGEGHVPLPRVDSLQEEAKKVGLLNTGLGLKVSILWMGDQRGKMGHGWVLGWWQQWDRGRRHHFGRQQSWAQSLTQEMRMGSECHWMSFGLVANEGDIGWHANEDHWERRCGMRDVYLACKQGWLDVREWCEGWAGSWEGRA